MRPWDDPAPGEREAGDRSWDIVRDAYEERIRVPRKRDWRPIAIAAAGAVVVAGAVTPPGHAVFGSLRDAVRGEPNAAPALLSLPTPRSRLLVNSADGAWVVQMDGSKRLLDGYRDASWSPHGLFLAATRGGELRALEPSGTHTPWRMSIERARFRSRMSTSGTKARPCRPATRRDNSSGRATESGWSLSRGTRWKFSPGAAHV